jgi:hypothetical protein
VIRKGGQAQRPAPTNGFFEDDLPCMGMELTAATNQPLIQNETSVGAGFHACPQQQISRYVETGRRRGLPLRMAFWASTMQANSNSVTTGGRNGPPLRGEFNQRTH